MPYIQNRLRDPISRWLDGNRDPVFAKSPSNLGELTFALTMTVACQPRDELHAKLDEIVTFYRENYANTGYAGLAEIMGALSCTAREYDRRCVNDAWGDPAFPSKLGRSVEIHSFTNSFYESVVAPYEDEKIRENGDVF